MEVSLQQILDAREQRVQIQQQLLARYGAPLVCFTMNIAGPVKVTPLILRGFEAGLSQLEGQLPRPCILHRQISTEATGCQAIFAVAAAASWLKSLCTQLEEATPLGRLWDMDVLDTDGKKLERKGFRSCMVCGAPGRYCAAGRKHSVPQLQAVTQHILQQHFALSDRKQVAALATQSLLEEVHITPKPGLVDRRNTGSHTDMQLQHFTASAYALTPYFEACVRHGQETAQQPPEDTFCLLRRAGLEAEQAMYRATGGINTHKGAIYTLGILCGAVGRLWTPEAPIAPTEAILSQCALLVQGSIQSDFAAVTGATAGERLYLQQGLTGVRGEAAAGLPSVARISLPVYRQALEKGLSPNDAGATALLHLIAAVEDTNLYHRGGIQGAAWAKAAAAEVLQRAPYPTVQQLEALDDAFIARRLSPGGCADLLAVTCFLHALQRLNPTPQGPL